MPTLNIVESVVIFDDTENASNPQRKHCDWRRSLTGLTLDQAYSERFLLTPGATKTLESGVGLMDLSTTPVDLAQVAAAPQWYSFRGAFPSSPWALPLGVGAQSATLTVQVDGSVLLAGSGLASIAAVRPGDWLYLAGSGYGDAGPFNPANQGFWSVVAVSAGLTLRRIDPTLSSVSETVTVAAVNNIQHLPDATRPRWLFVRGIAGYAGLFAVVGAAIGWLAVVAPSWFVPATALTFDRLVATPKYISYVRLESDQPVTVLAGDAAAVGNEVSLQPVAGLAWYESFAFTTSLAVKNAGGTQPATVNVIYALSQE